MQKGTNGFGIVKVNGRLEKAASTMAPLGVPACKVGAVLEGYATTTTTEPPEVSLSPDTVPLDTLPTSTASSATEVPPADQREESLASKLGVSRDFTFSDVSGSLAQSWIDTIDSTAIGRRTAGSYGGVEVTDSSGNVFARVLAFQPDEPTDPKIGRAHV